MVVSRPCSGRRWAAPLFLSPYDSIGVGAQSRRHTGFPDALVEGLIDSVFLDLPRWWRLPLEQRVRNTIHELYEMGARRSLKVHAFDRLGERDVPHHIISPQFQLSLDHIPDRKPPCHASDVRLSAGIRNQDRAGRAQRHLSHETFNQILHMFVLGQVRNRGSHRPLQKALAERGLLAQAVQTVEQPSPGH